MEMSWVRRWVWVGLLLVGCSGAESELSEGPVAPSADVENPVAGVPDLGMDPAVVAIDIGGPVACAGALIASDVVLTARHCVSASDLESACLPSAQSPPLLGPESLGVRVTDGEDFVAPRVRARAIRVPALANACGADIAIIELEEPIDTVQPLVVDVEGIALGGHVRSVGFGTEAGEPKSFEKRVRDHVAVVDATATEILLHETGCTIGCGGPAIDEATGEVVGVVSRGGPDGDVATRVDPFVTLVEAALAEASSTRPVVGASKEKKGPIDMGANCVVGADCAAGVCVTDMARRYCSRLCSPHDHCPAHYRCEASAQGSAVCVAD
jgi:hypothetical protein